MLNQAKHCWFPLIFSTNQLSLLWMESLTFSHLTYAQWKNLSHRSLDWHTFKKIIYQSNKLYKLEPVSKRKSSWGTISFLRTLECFGIPSETSGMSRSPTNNSGTLRIGRFTVLIKKKMSNFKQKQINMKAWSF